jgi:DNA-binding Lrp family transcriptional regulator
MAEAYILINTDVGEEYQVLDEIKKIDGVVEAYLVYGTYDVICKIESDELSDLKNRIMGKFRNITKIRNTMTLISVDQK